MTNFKALVKPDAPYFGEQDFTSEGQEFTVTVSSYAIETVQRQDGKVKKGVLHFKENVPPLILNMTNGKRIAQMYGKDADGWIGKRVTLYFDDSVRFGREVVGGVRVKAPVEDEGKKCADCGKPIRPFGRMTAVQTAAYTAKKYGRELCAACAEKEAKKE